ncbi:ABC transporter permease [uncultured Varibaculum sp.]|uniref:ABC transporter permease n=1 Tax=uncultured Varibaculum sp. TaxID=413896 RepID=UPI002674EA9D|nr:ABC transporter permease [uncultured Varibaculum sp.]
MNATARNILRQLATLLVSLVVASLVVFLLINLLPGDVTGVILGANADPGSVAQLRAAMGLDKPLFMRYFSWLSGMIRLDFGTSIFTGQAISQQLPHRLEATFSLVFAGMILALLLAIPLGMIGALRRGRKSGIMVSVLSQLGMAIPAFLAGMVLTIVFAVKLQVFPANGYVPFRDNPAQWAHYLVLPVLSIAIVQGAVLTRYTRSAFIEVLKQDYFRTARAIGWRYWAALVRHGVRNASLQVITVLGLQLSTLLVGAIVVEQVFAIPGLGTYLISAVAQRDLTVVQAVVMILVAAVLVINALVDVVYRLLDPRIRQEVKQ